jgi:hypothetical protein
MTNEGKLLDLGIRDYREIWDLQRKLVELRAAKALPDTLILVEHPHVFTVGKAVSGVIPSQVSGVQPAARHTRFRSQDRGNDNHSSRSARHQGWPSPRSDRSVGRDEEDSVDRCSRPKLDNIPRIRHEREHGSILLRVNRAMRTSWFNDDLNESPTRAGDGFRLREERCPK